MTLMKTRATSFYMMGMYVADRFMSNGMLRITSNGLDVYVQMPEVLTQAEVDHVRTGKEIVLSNGMCVKACGLQYMAKDLSSRVSMYLDDEDRHALADELQKLVV
jgi:hypothetical protein